MGHPQRNPTPPVPDAKMLLPAALEKAVVEALVQREREGERDLHVDAELGERERQPI